MQYSPFLLKSIDTGRWQSKITASSTKQYFVYVIAMKFHRNSESVAVKYAAISTAVCVCVCLFVSTKSIYTVLTFPLNPMIFCVWNNNNKDTNKLHRLSSQYQQFCGLIALIILGIKTNFRIMAAEAQGWARVSIQWISQSSNKFGACENATNSLAIFEDESWRVT